MICTITGKETNGLTKGVPLHPSVRKKLDDIVWLYNKSIEEEFVRLAKEQQKDDEKDEVVELRQKLIREMAPKVTKGIFLKNLHSKKLELTEEFNEGLKDIVDSLE